jgi:integrase
VRRLVVEAAKEGPEFGVLVEVAAVTGARRSQIARILVRDLKRDCVEMPSSRKGRGKKKILRRQVPIPPGLAARLREAARGKAEDAILLARPGGRPCGRCDHTLPFKRTAERAKLDPAVVTMYALRHSHITAQLLAQVPIRIVAAIHDTSVAMIERTYSAEIDRHADDLLRPTLLDMGPEFGRSSERKVVSL